MKNHMTRFLSRVLVLLMMLQLVSVGPVFATSASAENDEAEQEEILANDAEIADVEEAIPTEEPTAEEPAEAAPVEDEEPVKEPVFDTQDSTVEIVLKDGAAIIKTSDLNEVKAILAKALIANYDPEKDYSELEWEYECEGTGGLTGKLSNTAWGSIGGFTTKKVYTYTHPALWDNADGTYRVRLASNTDVVVSFTKATKLNSGITLVENPTLKLFYNDDGSVNYDEVRSMVLAQIASTTPEGLTADDLHVTYSATSNLGRNNWVKLEGDTVNLTKYPAMTAGEQQIKISYDGNESYYGTEVEFTVNVEVGRNDSKLEFVENPTIKLVYNDDLSVDYAAAYQVIFDLLEIKVPEDITLDDLTIEYYATAKTGSAGNLGKAWVPLEGGKETLTYPGISEGTQTIRVSYAGSKTYSPVTATAEVTVLGRPEVNVEKKEGPYNVGFVFADAENYDYDATARAIYDAVVASNDQGLGFEDFAITYNASTALAPEYKELNYSGLLNKFTDGTWTIRFSWDGTTAYKDGHFDVEVTVTDSREASAVVLKDGAEITYNMDASVMEQAIFDNAIDWENSTLPEDAGLGDFTIEYYASSVSETGAFDGAFKNWAPVGGGTVLLVKYPQMGAADAQQIRITYNGSAEYRPSEAVEGTLKVNKADVNVKVHSAIIHANEEVPADFVTIDPNDPKIDIYTVYAGISSSNVENDVSKLGGCIYLDLPDRFNDSSFMKMADAACKIACGKTLTEIMQEGTTVGALKKALSTQEILDLLKQLNIDTGAVGQLIEVLNKLPGVFDNTRVAFGTPNHAGVYTATAITDNANYNTGVGVGLLTVLKVTKGVKITWDEDIPKKLTQEEAEAFNWNAYLTVDGVTVKDTSSIHYLYSGFTSKWKPYSSTTEHPTEPGRYVVTVVTINGDYLAAPVTRTFQITK